MPTKADFKARRETLGLSQQNVADNLKVNIKTVKNWEKPGFQAPPDFAWDYLDEMGDLQAAMIDNAVEGTLSIIEEVGHAPESVPITYWRTQAQYDEFGRDAGYVGFINAAARRVALILDAHGVEVEFRYPDDGAISTPGSVFPARAGMIPASP